jgi:hypothetical protein
MVGLLFFETFDLGRRMMISVGSTHSCGIELEAFPDAIIGLYRMRDLPSEYSEIDTLINRPDLDHWISVVEKQVPLEDIIGWFSFNAYENMRQLLMMYSIIPVANRRSLKRKMCGPEYFRPWGKDSLRNLKWVSAKYAYVEPRKVLWMQSPVLLFDDSVSSFFADSWFSAFVSLLSSGTLDVVAYHTHFCLGTLKLNPADLSSS